MVRIKIRSWLGLGRVKVRHSAVMVREKGFGMLYVNGESL